MRSSAVIQSRFSLIALALLALSLGACMSVYGQPRASAPHGTVQVTIVNPNSVEQGFRADTLVLDGLEIDLSDQPSPFTLRLSPGKHELRLASRQMEYRNDVETLTTTTMDTCGIANCVRPVTVREDRVTLASGATRGCVRTFPLDVQQGQVVDITMTVTSHWQCY